MKEISDHDSLMLFNFNFNESIYMKMEESKLRKKSQFIITDMRKSVIINWNCAGLLESLEKEKDPEFMKVFILKTRDELIMYPYRTKKGDPIHKVDIEFKIPMLSKDYCVEVVGQAKENERI